MNWQLEICFCRDTMQVDCNCAKQDIYRDVATKLKFVIESFIKQRILIFEDQRKTRGGVGLPRIHMLSQ